MTQWELDRHVQKARDALVWIERFVAGYDLSALSSVKLAKGRSRRAYGVYGRCEYPTQEREGYRISCMLPGPWPCGIPVRRSPLYMNEDGTWPAVPAGCRPGVMCIDRRSGRRWYRLVALTRVNDLDEAVVWIFAHEAFHFLRRTRQIPGRNNEIQADAFGDACLGQFREMRQTITAAARERKAAVQRLMGAVSEDAKADVMLLKKRAEAMRAGLGAAVIRHDATITLQGDGGCRGQEGASLAGVTGRRLGLWRQPPRGRDGTL